MKNTSKSRNNPPIKLMPGDIFARRARGPVKWLLKLSLYPPVDEDHFGILWMKVGDDFIILESIASKGLAVWKLSEDKHRHLNFYRVNCPYNLRRKAPYSLITSGRAEYDWLLVARLALDAFRAFWRMVFIERRLRRLRPSDFHYSKNKYLICTEAVVDAYRSVGVDIIPPGTAPVPNALKEAVRKGIMRRIGQW